MLRIIFGMLYVLPLWASFIACGDAYLNVDRRSTLFPHAYGLQQIGDAYRWQLPLVLVSAALLTLWYWAWKDTKQEEHDNTVIALINGPTAP